MSRGGRKRQRGPIARRTDQPALHEFLRSLPHVGFEGFEGLVAVLLSAETGRRFALQKSGSQRGRDGQSEPDGEAVLAFEAKHYFSSASPELRPLLGELAELSGLQPQPDLWVLVTTAAMPPGDLDEIARVAAGFGFDVLCLDAGELPRLHILMAAWPEVVTHFADRTSSQMDWRALQRDLDAIRALPAFEAEYGHLQRVLDATLLGYEDTLAKAATAVASALTTKRGARLAFGQDVTVRAATSSLVKRTSIAKGLFAWLDGPAAGGRHMAVLGEEGSGKTWATFDWMANLLERVSADWLVLPMSASAENIGERETLDDLLPRLLDRWIKPGAADRWHKRLQRWLKGDGDRKPRILVVIDGLNERTDVEWPAFLAPSLLPERAGRTAVLVVDRPIHWQERCRARLGDAFQTLAIGGYSDGELAQALRGSAVPEDRIPPDLQELIRMPRYCGLVCRHYEEMVRVGDCTQARVFYLDLRDRAAAKDRYPLSEDELRDAIVEAARRHREAARGFTRREIADLAPSSGREMSVVEELLSSGLFVPVGGETGRFRVEPLRLSYAMGLLLAEHLGRVARSGAGAPALAEAIAWWFEPEPSADLKVEAAAAALFHATVDTAYPAEARRELLLHWLRLRNWDDAWRVAVLDYVRRIPDDFVAAAERLWCDAAHHGAGQDAVGKALALHRDDPAVLPSVVRAAERWLGLVHVEGHEIFRGGDAECDGSPRDEVARRLGGATEPGTAKTILGTVLHIVEDDGAMQLRRLAIVLLAKGRRTPFVQACIAWGVSSAVMGHAAEAEEMGWALRLIDEDLAALLMPRCRDLVGQGELGAEAGRHLLRVLGGRLARELAEQHRGFPNEAWERIQREHAEDPCTSWIALDAEQCVVCLGRADVSVRNLIGKTERWLQDPAWFAPGFFVDRAAAQLAAMDPTTVGAAMSVSFEDHLRDRLEVVLASRQPEALAAFFHKVVQAFPVRTLEALHAIGNLLPQVTPVLTARDAEPVLDAVQRIDAMRAMRTENDIGRQQDAFVSSKLLLGVLGLLAPSARLAAILQRPSDAFDPLDLEEWIEPLSKDTTADLIASIWQLDASSRSRVRALWILGACPPHNAEVAACVERCGTDADEVLRGVAFRVAYRSGNPELGKALAVVARPLQAKLTTWEASYGSSLVARWAGFLPIPELAARLHPAALTHSLAWQARTEVEAALAAAIFDLAWVRVVGAEPPKREPPPVEAPPDSETAGVGRPRLPDLGGETIRLIQASASWRNFDAPLREPRPGRDADAQARRWEEREEQLVEAWGTDAFEWHGMGFDAAGLELMVRARPDLAQRWAEAAMAGGAAGRRTRLQLVTFHDAFAAAMFRAEHPLALPLWSTLFQHAGSHLGSGLAASAFMALSTSASDAAKEQVLAACRVDKDLQELALTALRYGSAEWLNAAIKRLVRSPQLWRKATGLTLASFAEFGIAEFATLVEEASVVDTWVGDVAESLERRVEADTYARAWYARFWEEADAVAAWGAFRMVLATADARYHLWRRTIEPSESINWKRAFVACNAGELKRATEKRIGADDKLFGTRIDYDQIFPFAVGVQSDAP